MTGYRLILDLSLSLSQWCFIAYLLGWKDVKSQFVFLSTWIQGQWLDFFLAVCSTAGGTLTHSDPGMHLPSGLLEAACFVCFTIYLFVSFPGCARSSLLRGLFSSWGEWRPLSSCSVQASHCVASLVAGHKLESSQASVAVAPKLWSAGSIVVACELSCSEASGPSRTRDRTRCLLHWRADSSPPSHQPSPRPDFGSLASCGWSSASGDRTRDC